MNDVKTTQQNMYKIGNLTCQYYDKQTKKFLKVLDVEDINIYKGEVTVILGPSGSGKSTFMEAISLMSQTIDPESQNVFFFEHGDTERKVNIAQLSLDNKKLQKLRLENYCFIFQDTNIMGNFNPKENVALPKMVDKLTKGALEDADNILRYNLNLRIDLDKEANEYSGGQKQRFAFARAFMAKGDLLFGDEPTGNLDKYNSEKLFGVIRQNIVGDAPKSENGNPAKDIPDNASKDVPVSNTDCTETGSSEKPDDNSSDNASGKSNNKEISIKKIGAIIVTHSIELALQFADRIIVIVKPERIDDEEDKNGPKEDKKEKAKKGNKEPVNEENKEQAKEENKVQEKKIKEIVRGYTNPFLVYRNSLENAWRTDGKVNGNLDTGGLLPPIDDDGSTRFVYIADTDEKQPSGDKASEKPDSGVSPVVADPIEGSSTEAEINEDQSTASEESANKPDENGTQNEKTTAPKVKYVKDRLKKEIIFFLNNSYAAPQEILIFAAKELNKKLRLITGDDDQNVDDKKILFRQFDLLKKAVIEVVDEKALNQMILTEFENKKFLYGEVRKKFPVGDDILQLIPPDPEEKNAQPTKQS
jgi:putative ABC transport system ATP-binding protein